MSKRQPVSVAPTDFYKNGEQHEIIRQTKNCKITKQTLQSQSAKITLEKYNLLFSFSIGVYLPDITVTRLFFMLRYQLQN